MPFHVDGSGPDPSPVEDGDLSWRRDHVKGCLILWFGYVSDSAGEGTSGSDTRRPPTAQVRLKPELAIVVRKSDVAGWGVEGLAEVAGGGSAAAVLKALSSRVARR